MPHLARTQMVSVFSTEMGPRPAPSGVSADHEHVDRSLSVATALTPLETGYNVAGLPGSHFNSELGVRNLPPRTRGKHY